LQRDENQEFLVYHVTVRPNFVERYEYFIEANTGKVLDYYNHTCYLTPRTATATDLNNKSRTINTTEDGGTFYLFDSSRPMFKTKSDGDFEGAIITYDMKNTQLSNPKYEIITSSNNTWSNKTSVSAHYNAGIAYEYFKNVHNRNSINGQGGNIVSFINVPDEDGGGMDNAFWNGEFIFYGNGRQAFKPLAGALDVAGHEMTHGVVQNTANLEYRGQSGAINESMADVFGAMMDREDWKLGEDVTSTQVFPTGALRDLSNPHNGGNSLNDNGYQPRHTNEMYTGSQDNGGVHINSGIPNFAFFKLATAISKEKAEKIFYRALSQYLTRSSQFLDLRLAVVRAATDLHGASSTEVNAVKKAFDEVGIVDGTSTSEPEDIEVNPGTDFILSYDVSTTDENTLYVSGTDGKNFVPKTKTLLNNKPSVSDDGSEVVFIDENKKMRSLSLTGTTNETIISQDLWDNVALSKDGKRLAAISTEIDKAIWVYDFEKKKWTKFTLYNPTFTEGVTTGEVLYADALEWDYTGEYILYDAYNEIEDFSGEKISYWDVGIIKVWDNEANTIDEGEIFKIFTDLPEGWSIGDPTFSKNSPYIIAFDYFNEEEDKYQVMTANLETGDIGLIFQNSILGYPNYSKLDNKLIFNALATDDSEIIAVNNLKTDKLNPNGSPSALIPDAKWGVWYTQGQRETNPTGTEDELAEANLKLFPNPTKSNLKIQLEMKVGEELTIFIYDLQGKMRKETLQKASQSGINEFLLPLENVPSGMYMVRLRLGEKASSRKIVKE
jgi:Zn-dependent metalloprotease